jgi:hypothetical protein
MFVSTWAGVEADCSTPSGTPDVSFMLSLLFVTDDMGIHKSRRLGLKIHRLGLNIHYDNRWSTDEISGDRMERGRSYPRRLTYLYTPYLIRLEVSAASRDKRYFSSPLSNYTSKSSRSARRLVNAIAASTTLPMVLP